MSEIESISLNSEEYCTNDYQISNHVLELIFVSSKRAPIVNTHDNTTSVQIWIPFVSHTPNTFSKNKEDYKIIRAFEHLRKLCGAREPIDFE
jgi:hypothetical protein